jgi:hypothetical protein
VAVVLSQGIVLKGPCLLTCEFALADFGPYAMTATERVIRWSTSRAKSLESVCRESLSYSNVPGFYISFSMPVRISLLRSGDVPATESRSITEA